jgi:hypothetical protein
VCLKRFPWKSIDKYLFSEEIVETDPLRTEIDKQTLLEIFNHPSQKNNFVETSIKSETSITVFYEFKFVFCVTNFSINEKAVVIHDRERKQQAFSLRRKFDALAQLCFALKNFFSASQQNYASVFVFFSHTNDENFFFLSKT